MTDLRAIAEGARDARAPDGPEMTYDECDEAEGLFHLTFSPDRILAMLDRRRELEAVNRLALAYFEAEDAFRAFERDHPNDTTKRWDAVFEARNDARDRLRYAIKPEVPNV